MEIVRRIQDIREQVRQWRSAGCTIGLVPTMGALHEGHLALVDRSRARCQRTIATLFVNPTQFTQSEDFQQYPRQEARDSELLESHGCDSLFAPSANEMYPDGHRIPEQFRTTVHVHGLSEELCGAIRPGHFIGSATVVMKLLMIAGPDVAFFGEKDFQQLQVFRRMVRDLDVPVEIEGVETVREPDGLAMSSRNAYLTPSERASAPLLFRVLNCAAGELQRGSEVAAATARAAEALRKGGFQSVDYVALVDPETLRPIADVKKATRLLAAAWLGRARLIDNVSVAPVTRGPSNLA